MKHLSKRITALLLTIVMILGIVPTTMAVETEPVNVALGKTVTDSNGSNDGTYWHKSFLTDGQNHDLSGGNNVGWSSIDPVEQFERITLTVDLAGKFSVSKISLLPTAFDSGKFFPVAYTIAVSENGTDWKDVASDTKPNVPEVVPQEYNVDPVNASLVRVTITENRADHNTDGSVSKYMSQLGEIEVYGLASEAEKPDDETEDINIALNQSVTATDSMSGGGLYAPSYLTDGKYGDYPTEQQLGWCVTADAEATIRLSEISSIHKITLYPVTFESGKFFPTSYTISVSTDGVEWNSVAEKSDIPEVGTTPQVVDLDQVQAKFVKVAVEPRSVLEKNGSTSTYAQISEVEILGHTVPKEPELLSAGKPVTATDSMSGGGLYDPSYLTDGKLGNYPTDDHLGWCVTAAADATINLGRACSISKVTLYPVAWESGKFFPTAYTVSVSTDGENWNVVKNVTDVPDVGAAAQTVTFTATDAVYVKISVQPRSVVESNGSTSVYAQISEVEVYGFENEAPQEETTLGLNDYALAGYQNLALYKEGVTASDDNAHDGKAAKNVTDGILTDTSAFGWDTYGSNGIAWLQVDLGGINAISRVVVYPFWTATAVGEFFPAEYDLQVSLDGKEFKTVDTYVNPNPTGCVVGAVIHDIAETEARYVRINVVATVPKVGQAGLHHSQIGEINVYGFSRNLNSFDPYIPYNSVYTNIALGKVATASDDNAQWGMAAAHTTDGLLTTTDPYGWSTSQSDDPKTGIADLTIDLEQSAVVSRFVVYPFYINNEIGVYFPRSYELQVSTDGSSYTSIATVENNSDVVRPQVVDLEEAVEAKFVRVHVTDGGYNANSSLPYCTQIGEVSVYGIYTSNAAVINKTALRMMPGDMDYIKIKYYGLGESDVTYSSEDPSIATVSENGRVEAIEYGNTVIHVKDATSGSEYDVTVLVDDYDATQNLMISAFWPMQDYNMTDEYMDNMKNVGITNVQLNYVLNVANYKDNLQIAQMAYERGMGVTVSEKDWGWGNIASYSAEDLYEQALKYSHVPGVIGYYTIDEPSDASVFAKCFAPIKRAMPTADVHLNFVPNEGNYRGLLDIVGSDLDYLMWDAYIYPNAGINEATLFTVSEAGRVVGLEYGVKTAQYVQACGFNGAFRKPNGNEIRYNVNACLAYGNKQIAYFTYRIPEGVGETFTSAIVNADGTKTDIYDEVAEINAAALALGPTLMGVEALDVYHTGETNSATKAVPEDFFIQAESSSARGLIVSYMKNLETKQNYAMLVNRDYENAVTVTFNAAEAAGAVQYVRQEDGEVVSLEKAGENYTVELAAGGCILLKVDDSYDYMPNYGEFVETAAGSNAVLASETKIEASGSNKGQLRDGARIANTYTDGCGLPGYTATMDGSHRITVDFGGLQTVNRVDLYPGDVNKFPTDFILEGSVDGKTWTTLAAESNYVLPENSAYSVTFATEKYQYVRLTITKTESGNLQICEVEVYNDDGSVSKPKALNGAVPVDKLLTPADNLARGNDVKVICSDEHAELPYWDSSLLNDGVGYDCIFSRSNAGWSSAANRSSAAQSAWVGYDLGGLMTIDKVIVYNAWHDRPSENKAAECYPSDYMIQVSMDGKSWTNVYEVYNDTNWTEVGARVLTFDAVTARYVRVYGARLGRCGEGFAMQLSEVEVYGTAFQSADKTALNAAIENADTLVQADYTSASWTAFTTALEAAKTVAAKETATQEEVDKAAEALTNAVSALQKLADKTALNAAIQSAEALNQADYTSVSWSALTTALEAAKTAATKEAATQAEVDKAAEALTNAVSALQKLADKTALSAVIEEAEKLNASEYTEETWSQVAAAMEAAKAVAANENATQAEVAQAEELLKKAVAALEKKPVKPEISFVDVQEDDWFYDEVMYAAQRAYIKGVGNDKFAPDEKLTRAMLVTILYRMSGGTIEEGQKNPFTDLKKDAWYYDAITWAANNSIVKGVTVNKFAPDKAITREQMVTILYRYAVYCHKDVTSRSDLSRYKDANRISNYAKDAVSWAVAEGVIVGRSNTVLAPQSNSTRAEAAAVIVRIDKLLK